MTRLERRTFEAVVDAVCAPEPPLPPVHETDAATAFAAWMAAAPAVNRLATRATLLVFGACRFASRSRSARARWIPEPLRAAAGVAYYGDQQASAVVRL